MRAWATQKRAFYQYHSCLMEPWDGPASIAFTDGRLHRRGARSQRPAPVALLRDQGRPGRSWRPRPACSTCPPTTSCTKGRLQPGRMFLVDTEQGRIVDDEEIKRTIATERPYRQWLDEHLVASRRSAGRAEGASSRITTRCCSGRSRSATRSKTSACILAPMAQRRRRSGRLDGQRHAARGALEQAAAALRLFQAALRAGHQPADRLHPRGDHHLGRDAARLRRQPARTRSPRTAAGSS